ncbi:hypothetical protein ACQEU6_23635 [Spirillospora sp. CA-108201]
MVASAVLAAPVLAAPVLAVPVLAVPVSHRLGDAAFLAVGPAVIFVALIGWVTVVLTASRRRHHYPTADDGLPHRGPVMGGVIMGSPSQRTRRDPAPSVTHREVMAHIEQARAEEAAAEPAAQAPPSSEDLARPAGEATGRRGRHRGRGGAGRRRRFGPPRLR